MIPIHVGWVYTVFVNFVKQTIWINRIILNVLSINYMLDEFFIRLFLIERTLFNKFLIANSFYIS